MLTFERVLCALGWGTLIRQAFYSVPPSNDIHQRDTGNLPNSPS